MQTTPRPLELSSFTTGHTETPAGIRNSFAFDLRRIRSVADDEVAVIELPRWMALDGASVELRLPLSNRSCARAKRGHNTFTLNAEARAELKAASGAFFYLDAVFTSPAGEPLRANAGANGQLLLTLHRAKAPAYRAAA